MSDESPKILIVDDDPEFRRTLADVLEQGGYDTTAVATPQTAVHTAEKEMPSVAIIDLKLENASGLEVMRQIRDASPDTECIVLTGYASQESAIEAINVGAYRYVQKPYNLQELLLTIRRACEQAGAQKALRESEEKYRLVVEGASEGIALLDLKGTIQEVNPKALQLSGLERQDLIGKNFAQLLPGLRLDVASILRAFKTIATGGDLHQHEWTMVNKEGEPVTFIAHHSPVRKAGRITGLSVIMEDVTERKRTETELQESEQKYRILVEQSLQGMVVAQGTPPRFVFANSALAEIAGYTVEDLLSLSGEQIVSLVHPEDRDVFFQRYRERLQGLPSAPHYQFRAIRKDGEVRWLELHASRIEYGGEPAVQAVFVDVTERVQAEKELRESYEVVRKTLLGTVDALAAAVEKRDPYTAGHQRRVSDLAAAVAREMGLPPDQISAIQIAGMVHDVGKIYVPAEILSKPSKLTEIEITMIRTHPQVGFDVLKTVDFPWPVAEIVLQHHERWNGSGYPRGLAGDEICLEARILAVADVIEAMVSHRPYRPAHPLERALEEIMAHRGVLYHPDVVDTVVTLITENGYKLKSATDEPRDD
jgi:PAS domain S-box-containing protein